MEPFWKCAIYIMYLSQLPENQIQACCSDVTDIKSWNKLFSLISCVFSSLRLECSLNCVQMSMSIFCWIILSSIFLRGNQDTFVLLFNYLCIYLKVRFTRKDRE